MSNELQSKKSPSEGMRLHCHHDDLVLDDRDVRLLTAYGLWVDTARAAGYGPDWVPGYPDLMKSRLFWWIRAGNKPLPSPPPTAYSCPWYEAITEDRAHHIMEISRIGFGHFEGKANISQCIYEIESLTESEGVVSYGPYRFRVWRDIEATVNSLAAMNRHYEGDVLEKRKGEWRSEIEKTPNLGWSMQIIDGHLYGDFSASTEPEVPSVSVSTTIQNSDGAACLKAQAEDKSETTGDKNDN